MFLPHFDVICDLLLHRHNKEQKQHVVDGDVVYALSSNRSWVGTNQIACIIQRIYSWTDPSLSERWWSSLWKLKFILPSPFSNQVRVLSLSNWARLQPFSDMRRGIPLFWWMNSVVALQHMTVQPLLVQWLVNFHVTSNAGHCFPHTITHWSRSSPLTRMCD